jgi:sugar lactone lactonase YvrE
MMIRTTPAFGLGLLAFGLGLLAGSVHGQEPAEASVATWKAGVAKVSITPRERMRMAGYASRKEPNEGTEQELYAKALALQDARGQLAVFITLDLIGVVERLRTSVSAKLRERFQLPDAHLVMNASHTHCGPAYDSEEAQAYFAFLESQIVQVVSQAMESMEPSRLSYSTARCGFAMNRRTPSNEGFRNHPNPDGPVDHTVPVLCVQAPDGPMRAVLFGYACHNTTMGFLKWLGDYAGYAQEYLEQDLPGTVALFMMGCGGDQNPYPRSQLQFAKQHGRSLATAVQAALEMGQKPTRHQAPLDSHLECTLETVPLAFATAGKPDYEYPIQAICLGQHLLMVALASEATIDYSLRLKRELLSRGFPDVWVAGYSNAYNGYIPSRRVLLEGGYEAQSRPWRPTLEERIVAKVHELAGRVQSEPLFVARPLTEPGSFTSDVEGPACDASGQLFAVNFERHQSIGRVTPGGQASIFVDLPGKSVGNGICFDSKGKMYVADYVEHNVLEIDPITRNIRVLAHNPSMNQPNDLAIAVDGTLYASDPNWSAGTGQLWRIDPDGATHRLQQNMGTTNGIEVSPDGKTLYINESVQRNVWAYDIGGDGTLSNKRLLRQFEDHGLDGMRCDVDGNLYITRHGKGTVVKLSPSGEIRKEIDVLGSSPTNICFGGPDGRTAYVTEAAQKRIVQFRTDRPGHAWLRLHGATQQP